MSNTLQKESWGSY